MGDKFTFTIESMHKEINTTSSGEVRRHRTTPAHPSQIPYEENILNLAPEILAKRQVHYMDISKDQLSDKKFQKADEDPATFHGNVSGLGPLNPGWQRENWKQRQSHEKEGFPMTCAYKLVTVQCRLFGLGGRVESQLMAMEIEIFLRFYKQVRTPLCPPSRWTLTRLQVFCWSDDWWNLSTEEMKEHAKKMNDDCAQLLENAEVEAAKT